MRTRKHHHRKRNLFHRHGFYGLLIAIIFVLTGCYWMFRFPVLPGLITSLILEAEVILLVLIWYLLLVRHRKWMKVAGYILVVILCLPNGFFSWFISDTMGAVDRMNTTEYLTGDYVELYVLKDSVIEDVQQMDGRTIGILNQMPESQADMMISWLDEQNITYELKQYDSSLQMAQNLKGAAIDGIILYQPYLSVIEGYEGMETFSSDIRSLHQIECPKQELNKPESVNVTDTAFTILISGIDTYGTIGSAGRSDVNILMTVNPEAREILMVSIPRDYYVESVCPEDTACAAGEKDKLTHTGIYGIDATEMTLEKFFNIPINYNVRVNFTSLIQIIDTLGGVDVNNPNGFSVGSKDFPAGEIHLNGEDALIFSRERYSFETGDRERGRNQMRVIDGIIRKAMSPAILKSYSAVLDTVSNSVEMNISTEDIVELINMQLSKPSTWKIYSYSVMGSDAIEYSPALGANAYMMEPDEDSVEKAKQDIHAVLAGEKPLFTNK